MCFLVVSISVKAPRVTRVGRVWDTKGRICVARYGCAATVPLSAPPVLPAQGCIFQFPYISSKLALGRAPHPSTCAGDHVLCPLSLCPLPARGNNQPALCKRGEDGTQCSVLTNQYSSRKALHLPLTAAWRTVPIFFHRAAGAGVRAVY